MKTLIRNAFLSAVLALVTLAPAAARSLFRQPTFDGPPPASFSFPGEGTVEVAFSPHEGAEQLVIKSIDSAQKSIRLLAYSFTNPNIVRALVRAKKRGVDVAIVVDYKNNIEEDRYGKARAALNTLREVDVTVKVIKVYPIQHDKAIVVDSKHVETGSFNFSQAAENINSEYVVVMWDSPKVAAAFLKHWRRNDAQAVDYRPTY